MDVMNYVPAANSVIAIALYWVPLAFCVVGYTVRTWRHFRDDLTRRTSGEFYIPQDTVGTLIGRAVVTVFPMANLWAACFDVGPQIFSKFFAFIGRIFDQPLVPRRRD